MKISRRQEWSNSRNIFKLDLQPTKRLGSGSWLSFVIQYLKDPPPCFFVPIKLIIALVLHIFSHALKITCPEESFTLVASTPQEKVHLWFKPLLLLSFSKSVCKKSFFEIEFRLKASASVLCFFLCRTSGYDLLTRQWIRYWAAEVRGRHQQWLARPPTRSRQTNGSKMLSTPGAGWQDGFMAG